MLRSCRLVGSRGRRECPRTPRPVSIVADARITVGDSEFPLFVSRDWSAPLPGVRRAVLVLHGRLRNANVYYRSALKALAAAGAPGAESLMIAPQFLAGIDLSAHILSDRTLHWSLEGWEGGEPAEGPNRMPAPLMRSTRSCGALPRPQAVSRLG